MTFLKVDESQGILYLIYIHSMYNISIYVTVLKSGNSVNSFKVQESYLHRKMVLKLATEL